LQQGAQENIRENYQQDKREDAEKIVAKSQIASVSIFYTSSFQM